MSKTVFIDYQAQVITVESTTVAITQVSDNSPTLLITEAHLNELLNQGEPS